MATTRRRSRREPLWGAYTQLYVFRGEEVAHAFPLFGAEHVVEGYPGCQCWCHPKVEITEDGTLLTHNQVH